MLFFRWEGNDAGPSIPASLFCRLLWRELEDGTAADWAAAWERRRGWWSSSQHRMRQRHTGDLACPSPWDRKGRTHLILR
jgi:hypothetical protein